MKNGLIFRRAVRTDLPAIVRLLADDDLGSQRERDEDPLPDEYYKAFEEISKDNNHELIAAELDGKVVGTLQLIFLPSISLQGRLRSQVESVRVDKNLRGHGIGAKMMEFAIQRARERRAHVMQLTSHGTRKDAHRFYERLGFKNSHVGMKLNLE